MENSKTKSEEERRRAKKSEQKRRKAKKSEEKRRKARKSEGKREKQEEVERVIFFETSNLELKDFRGKIKTEESKSRLMIKYETFGEKEEAMDMKRRVGGQERLSGALWGEI